MCTHLCGMGQIMLSLFEMYQIIIMLPFFFFWKNKPIIWSGIIIYCEAHFVVYLTHLYLELGIVLLNTTKQFLTWFQYINKNAW